MAVSTFVNRSLAAAVVTAFAVPAAWAQDPQPAPPKPYAAIKVTPPQPYGDASFAAFRKDLAGIAATKDRGALAKVLSPTFFWLGENGDKADKKKAGIDNLAAAIGLDDKDGFGWQAISAAAMEQTLEEAPDRKGVMCGPAGPDFDEAAAKKVTEATGTDLSEYGYVTAADAPVRDAPKAGAAVIDKLGQILVRLLPQERSGGEPFFRVVTPSGKTGFVQADAVALLAIDQLCYVKDGGTWKIAGYAGD